MNTHSIFIVAGEPSGDLHGANLVRELRRIKPDIAIHGLGGERMAAAGMELTHDLAKEAIMGFTEVLRKLGRIRTIFRDTVDFLEKNRPDLLVLIDYPGFNLRLAERASRLGVRTVYYICPQVWAWGRRRVHRIARLVEKVLVILDFEQGIYQDVGLSVQFVGHPLIDHIERTRLDEEFISRHKREQGATLGLLPGSRPQEVKLHLPIMLGTIEILHRQLSQPLCLVACPNERIARLAQQMIDKWRDERERTEKQSPLHVEVALGKTYEVITLSDMCLVASGTATLETTYFLKPMVVMYKTSFTSWLLARSVVKVEHIAMVNILAGEKVIPEFIQSDARPERIAAEALAILGDEQRKADIERTLQKVKDRLGTPGASERAARTVIDLLRSPRTGTQAAICQAASSG